MFALGLPTARFGGGSTTTLYRAVMPDELARIEASGGRLTNVAASSGGKYFATTERAAAQYAKMAVTGFGDPPYTIVSATIPTKLLKAAKDITTTVDRGIPSVRLPDGLLQHLSAGRIHNSMPIP